MKNPMRVAITGAAGNIGYALTFRIAAGDMLGADQPVVLQLIEIPPALDTLKGVVMELNDCAFPLLAGVVATTELAAGFGETDLAFLVGAQHVAGGDAEGEGVADVAGCPGDGDAHGCLHERSPPPALAESGP